MADRRLRNDATRKQRSLLTCSIAAAFLGLLTPAWADYVVGTGATSLLSSSRIDLACTDLIVSGTLNVDSAAIINVSNVIVQPGGVLHGGSGSIAMSGSLTVAPGGQFLPEQSTVTTNSVCGVAPGTVQVIPALANEVLITLAAMLALMAALVLRRRVIRRQRGISKGAET